MEQKRMKYWKEEEIKWMEPKKKKKEKKETLL